MTLDELYEGLAIGELSQHQFGKSGMIQPVNKPAINHYLNAGLLDLHTRLPLLEREVIIQQYSGITDYKLSSKYAQSNTASKEPVKYIMDTAEQPFTDDIIKIEFIYDEGGNFIPVNDENDMRSLFTTAWDTLQIPFPVDTTVSSVIYRARHPLVPREAAGTMEISMHPSLIEALHGYIAYRCFTSLGNAASAGLAAFFKQGYEEAINQAKRTNLLQGSEADSNIKLSQKGFI